MNFKPFEFIKNLKYMGEGMLSILVVIAIIIAVVMILNKVTADKEEN